MTPKHTTPALEDPIVYFNNCRGRDHVAIFRRKNAFFDLSRESKKAMNLRRGQTCVVASYAPDGRVTFDWYSFQREDDVPDEYEEPSRLFVGSLTKTETVSKDDAARGRRYAAFFDVNGNFKQQSVPEYTLPNATPRSSDGDTLVEDLEDLDKRSLKATTKKALINARIGQGTFREKILESWGYCCCLTGSCVQEAIRASHIKPWRESTDEERLDPHNGLPLVASLDALFDSGLVAFDPSGKVIVSSDLNAQERRIFGIGKHTLRRKPSANEARYLAYHRRKHGFD